MKLSKIVPGATYSGEGASRRVISRKGTVLHRKWNENKKDVHTAAEETDYFDDAKILDAQQRVVAGTAIGNPVTGAWKDLSKCIIEYVETGGATVKSATIEQFAEWAAVRVD